MAGAARDLRREQHFIDAGFRVLRFWNVDIDTAMDGVIQVVLDTLALPPPASR